MQKSISTQPTVLGIGEIPLDTCYLLSAFPQEDSKVEPTDIQHSVGGPVTAALILLKNLNCQTTIISRIGDDPAGKVVTTALSTYGLTAQLQPAPVSKHNTYLVNQISGSRTGIKCSTTHPPITTIPDSLVQEADLIVFDRHEPYAMTQVLEQKTSSITIMDPSTSTDPTILALAARTTLPIIPLETVKQLSPDTSLDDALLQTQQILDRDFVVTAGSLGSMYYSDSQLQLFPSKKITCVDALGAGDVFRGAVGYGLLQGWSIPRSLNFANTVSALQCTKVGNGTAIPSQEEVQKAEQTFLSNTLSINQVETYFSNVTV